MKVLITTVPFGEDRHPIDLLEKYNIDYVINPIGRKLTEDELAEMVSDFDIIIAGTESITKRVMDKGKKLKMISRVGIGLDSVDLISAKDKGISVSYTPDAPAPAVAELTIGLIISLLRLVQISNIKIHNGSWDRYFGRRLSECTIGIIGMGRIGSKVLKHLSGFECKKILLNDTCKNNNISESETIKWVEKEKIYKEADINTLHLPLTKDTKNMICIKELMTMKNDAVIINTSRGGIINENDLYKVLKNKHLKGAAIDVFDNEPYYGDLATVDNCLLTAHMGSMTVDCRTRMEVEATEEALRFINNEKMLSCVPKEEYLVQEM